MNKRLFHGYNCFSAVIGQHFINIGRTELVDTIMTRWTFDFNKEMIFDNVWFVGSCVEPADYLLQHDLQTIDGVTISAVKSDSKESMEIMSDELLRIGSHPIMVDFYELKSIEWERMERFGFYPRHLPHFINVTGETQYEISYQDPQYRFAGIMSKEDLTLARSATVCDLEIDYEYYQISFAEPSCSLTPHEKLKYQFERYKNNHQVRLIENFRDAIATLRNHYEPHNDFDWTFNVYLGLQSIVDMRQNLAMVIDRESLGLNYKLLQLVLKWVSLRKDFMSIYKHKSYDMIPTIMKKLTEIQNLEITFTDSVLRKVGKL